jgi:hypothetical protein
MGIQNKNLLFIIAFIVIILLRTSTGVTVTYSKKPCTESSLSSNYGQKGWLPCCHSFEGVREKRVTFSQEQKWFQGEEVPNKHPRETVIGMRLKGCHACHKALESKRERSVLGRLARGLLQGQE